MKSRERPGGPIPDAVELLQQLIRFESINPPGKEAACIEFIRELLASHGVCAQIYARDPQRPNIVAKIAGRGIAPPLLLYGHADVVPVEGQAWSVPPFQGLVKDGFVWGRGALDMKGGLTMLLLSFLSLLKSPPPGDLIFTVLSDEERGGGYGAEFLAANHPEPFAGVRHAIGEFGGFTMTVAGQKVMPIQVAEKTYCCVDLVFQGPGGHASIPNRTPVTADVGRFLVSLDQNPMPVRISEPTRRMLEALGSVIDGPLRKILFAQLRNRTLAPFVLKMMPPNIRRVIEPLLRSLVTPTQISGGVSRNVLPQKITVKCDGRLVPGDTPEMLEQYLRRHVPATCDMEIIPSAFITRPTDFSQFQLLADIARETIPDAVPIPMILPAVTDARHFSSLGIQTYGFLPMDLPSKFDFMTAIHGVDERIPAASLDSGIGAISKFIARYRG